MEQSSLTVAPTVSGVDRALGSLRRRWLALAVLGAGLIVAGYLILKSQWSPIYAQRWLITTSLILIYEMVLLWRGLERNRRRADESLLPTLGPGNTLTLIRGLMLALLGGFLFSPWPTGWLAWGPGALYILAGVLDIFDGFAARMTQHTTQLGEYLDLEFDALGVFIAPLLAILYGQLPVWYLAVSTARYAFVLGIWWRKHVGIPVHSLTSSIYRRPLAGSLMGLVGVALLPLFFSLDISIVATVHLIVFLSLFGRDWLVVSGRINPESVKYLVWSQRIEAFAVRWLPVALRLVVMIAAIWIVSAHLLAPESLPAAPGLLAPVIVTAIAIALGLAGRIAGLVMLGVIGLGFPPSELDIRSLLIAATAAISILGTGAASMWRPEDKYLIGRVSGENE